MDNAVWEIANSPVMWIACGAAVALIIVQSIFFARKAFKSGLKMGLSAGQMKGAMKSAAIASIGPSIVVLSGMLSLLVSVGGPIAWMRLSFIGSVMFEGMAAGFGTQAVGVTLGEGMTPLAYSSAVWTMVLGSIGWIIFATITAGQMDKVQTKIAGSDTKMLTVIAMSAILGAFGGLSGGHIVRMNKNTVACIAGGIAMFAMMMLYSSTKKKWINEWALTVAIIVGMLVTLAF